MCLSRFESSTSWLSLFRPPSLALSTHPAMLSSMSQLSLLPTPNFPCLLQLPPQTHSLPSYLFHPSCLSHVLNMFLDQSQFHQGLHPNFSPIHRLFILHPYLAHIHHPLHHNVPHLPPYHPPRAHCHINHPCPFLV